MQKCNNSAADEVYSFEIGFLLSGRTKIISVAIFYLLPFMFYTLLLY